MFINRVKSVDIRKGDLLTNAVFRYRDNNLKKFDTIIMNDTFCVIWKGKENEILNSKYRRFIYGTSGISSAELVIYQ